MKIAISADSENLDATVNPVFGRCPGFIIAETENGEIKSKAYVKNQALNSPRGAGIAAAQTVADQMVEAVITGNMGPNALMVLGQTGIKVYQAGSISVKEAVKQLAEGKLEELKQAVGAGSGGRGLGRGNP